MTSFRFSWPDKSKLSKNAFLIVKTLRSAGFKALVAGGAVRDALLKKSLKEIDIATSAKPHEVAELFAKTIPTGEKHGTIIVYPHFISSLSRGRKRGYEVTTFRAEEKYFDFRRPSKVKFIKSAEEDAKRRDFTINALFYDPETSEVIDYVNGIADLSHRKINLVGNEEARIREDALRMLRAVRFATMLEFDLAPLTRQAIKKNSKLIKKISAERIKQELDKIMMSNRSSVGMGLLDIVGLLTYILPEVKQLQGVAQPKNQHSEGDVYTHSLLCLEKMDGTFDPLQYRSPQGGRRRALGEAVLKGVDLPTRYALLFHDLGKAKTKKIREGKITFYDHQNIGAEMAQKICKRLRFSSADTQKVTWLAQNHLVPNDFVKMRLSTRRKWGLSPYFPDLLKLFRADAQASLPANPKKKPNLKAYILGQKILQEIQSKPVLKRPLLSGREVMKILRIKEGPGVGKVLKILEEKKLSGRLKTKKDALIFLRSKIF